MISERTFDLSIDGQKHEWQKKEEGKEGVDRERENYEKSRVS